ncbi:unnamed protein product [Peniophora sp. CBMAI 1063]|nr:unnamed protein product [Peniophora sp. CBMAI 1063]
MLSRIMITACGDYGVWRSRLTGPAVAKNVDALLYLDANSELSNAIPLARLVRGADIPLVVGYISCLPDETHEPHPDESPSPTSAGAPWIAVQSCKDANPATLLRAAKLGASAAVLYTTTAEPCLSVSDSLTSYARASLVPPLSIFVVRDARDASMLDIMDMPALEEVTTSPIATRGMLLDFQPASPLRIQRRETSNESMIVLYTITGSVAALFCILIGTGIFRAWRHPERYRVQEGVDAGTFGAGAGGTLTRAILDTFPVIKFGAPARPSQDDTDEEKDPNLYEMGVRRGSTEKRISGASDGDAGWNIVERPMSYAEDDTPAESANGEAEASTSTSPVSVRPRPRPAREPSSAPAEDAPLPDQIGRETCPICIVDFEEGDDLRVLPCDGHHRFHQTCVDPWLLELSTSCPLCRQDFVALQNIISGASQDGHVVMDPQTGELGHWELRESGPRHSSVYGRFSKYLRFALARRRGLRGSRGGEQFEEEVPPLPTEPPSAVLASHGATSIA